MKVTIQSTRATAAVPQLAQPADGFHPAKDLLDQLPFLLTDGVAGVTGRPAVNRAAGPSARRAA